MWRLSSARASRLLTRSAYGIINPRIYHNKDQFNHDKRIKFYPIVGLKGTRSATILMNKPNYNNVSRRLSQMLNVECVEEMFRFFRSFDIDESVNHIWVENRGVNCFGGGIEFEELVKDDDYLRKLFLLASTFAKINKPVLGHVKGSVRGASAYLLCKLSKPFGSKNAHLQLNDIDHGWVPTCGGSYHLSRMTGDIGTYLALTGESINADEMCELGFLHALLRQGKKGWQYQAIASKSSRLAAHYHYVDEMDGADSFDSMEEIGQIKQSHDSLVKQEQMHLLRTHTKEQLALYLTKSLLKQQQVERANIEEPETAWNIRDYIINYFKLKEDAATLGLEEQDLFYPSKGEVFRRLPLSKINLHFHHNTIEKIMESLEKDSSSWAQKTLSTLREKDPLALKLTLKLVREANNSDFSSCLDREYRVACRLRQSQNFQQLHTTKKVSGSLSEITDDLVNSYFSEEDAPKLEHGLRRYALYPVKQYKDVLPDSVRYFLNRDFWDNPNQASNQRTEVIRWIRAQNINVENPTFDPDVVREKVWVKLALKRKIKAELDAIADMLYDQNLEKQYREKRKEHIKTVLGDEAAAKELIDQQIALLFRHRIKERGDELDETAKCYGQEQQYCQQGRKSKLFAKIRDILTEKRLTVTSEDDYTVAADSFQGLVYFPKDNRKGILETFNHNLTDTPLEIVKRRIDEGRIDEPFTDLQEAEMLTPIHSDRDRQYTLENSNYREYKLRYNEEPPGIFKNMFGQMIEIAQSYTTNMNEVLEKLSPEELEQSLMQETYRGVLYADLVKKFMKEIQEIPEGPEPITFPQADWYSALKSEDIAFEDGVPVFKLKDDPIPDQLKGKFGRLLQRIYRGICQNYGKWEELSKLSSENVLDRELLSAVSTDWNEFVKNDVAFLFAYFSIREVELILKEMEKNRIQNDGEKLIAHLKEKHGIEFASIEEASEAFNTFMYKLIEMYDQGRQRLLLLSSKQIERMNRKQAKLLTQKSEPSLQNFLFALAKERSVLLDRLNRKINVFEGDAPAVVDSVSGRPRASNIPAYLQKQAQNNTKRLVEGSTYYLRELSRLYMMVMGPANFIPQELALEKSLVEIPQFFDELDQRKPIELWFEEKLQNVLRSIFDFRYHHEQRLTRKELLAFDKEFSQMLHPQSVKGMMLLELENEMRLLEYIRAGNIQEQAKVEPEHRRTDFLMLVKNKDAMHRLNTLLMTAKMEEFVNQSENLLDDYEQTIERLLTESLSEKKEKKLDEKQLQSENFRWIASQREAFDQSESQRQKLAEKDASGKTERERKTLAAQLRGICQLHSQDSLFAELATELRREM